MERFKGLLSVSLIMFFFIILIIDTIGIIETQGSALIPMLALGGISFKYKSGHKGLFGILRAIYIIIFIIGVSTLFIATNVIFVAGMQIFVGILLIISYVMTPAHRKNN